MLFYECDLLGEWLVKIGVPVLTDETKKIVKLIFRSVLNVCCSIYSIFLVSVKVRFFCSTPVFSDEIETWVSIW